MTIQHAASDTAEAISVLKSVERGEVLQPGDPTYDEARKVYNAMIDRHPSVIVRCSDVADVISAVNFAREQKLPVSIRGGGHNVAGFAVNDDGVVIDLSLMKGIHVDPARRVVRAEGGVTWGDLDHATHPFGFAVPGGIISTTGVAGLTLGGGIGNLTRTYGLSCDSLLSADVVTADGKMITASSTENSDLFWALRGGGGNFGVVTSFEFRLQPADTVLAGFIIYPLELARDAMRNYRDFMRTAPSEVNAYFGFHLVPPAPFINEEFHLKNMCLVSVCYVGDMAAGERELAPLRTFGPPAQDLVAPTPLPAVNNSLDALVPKGNYDYWKSDFVDALTDEAIDVHVVHGALVPTISSGMHLYPVDGFASTIGSDATAWGYRQAHFTYNIYAMDPDGANTEKNKAWVRAYYNALHPYSMSGGYVNFMMGDEGDERVRAAYGSSYDRLAQIKRQVDPENLFRLNQNITPTA
ncbi:MAG: oxidoreductase [Chloroflexi bacterium]|nr:MAG: oxidoreductase [Chloroflexota bacterium]